VADSPFDFVALEEHLVTGCRAAIARIATEIDPDDPAVFFAVDCNPYYGDFLPSLDTRTNATACLRGIEAAQRGSRGWVNDASPDAWRTAHTFARHQSLRLFHDEISEFSHHMFDDLKYEVAALTRSPEYAQLNAGAGEDGWIEGHCRAVLQRVCDRLVDGGAFDTLPIARPFGIGYAYHDEPLIVCRALV
jgi:hypothetical protein